MNEIQRLIHEMCPDGVPMVALGEVLNFEQPTKYIVKSTEYNNCFPIPVLTAGQSFILGYTNETEGIYEASKEKPTIIFDDFTTSSHWVDFPFKVKSSAMKMLRPNNDDCSFRYIFYAMRCIDYVPIEHARHWIGKYSLFQIPLPPLPIQQRIVEILDKFTSLVSSLDSEIALRQKQYEYYRNKFLSFEEGDEGVEWTTLEKIAEIGTGSSNTNEGIEDGVYPFYTRGQEVLTKNEYEFDETAIITAGDGVGVGKVFHYVSGKYALHQRAYRIHIMNDNVLPRYYYHYMVLTFYGYISQNSVFSSVNSVRKPKLLAYPVPVVPLPKQLSIVRTLDLFESLLTNLKKERELRQKQYEYYREKLLTFA